MGMSPAVYEGKRNSLLALIEDTLNQCVDLDQKTKQEIMLVAGKLRRNCFEIVLSGEFQGGKSTTFDTICDGRIISPRGIGIKTSATKISAISIPENEQEYVDVSWKTERELLLTLMCIIEGSFGESPERRDIFYDPATKDLKVTLQTPGVLEIAKECVSNEWKIYEINPRAYDQKNEGRLDMLQIATLVLKFCNDPQLNQYRSKKRITVNELQTMVTFPIDWAERWVNRQNAQFELSEILFVFLSNAFCHIHCKNLERLGCVITDCPGLFAGPWDTEVANSAMRQADAILYLIGGQTAIRESDLRALGAIINSKQEHKLFFAINARHSKKHIETNFVPTDCSSIRSRGLDLNEKDIFVFNSRLAFNAKSFPYVTDKGRKQWNREIGSDLALFLDLDATDDADLERIRTLRKDPALLLDVSGFSALIERIESAIIKRKAEALLVKGGTDILSYALDKLSGELKSTEDSARKTKEECEIEAKEANDMLQKFHSTVRKWVDEKLDNSSYGINLCNNFIQEVCLSCSAQIAEEITLRISQMLKSSLASSKGIIFGIIVHVVKQKLGFQSNLQFNVGGEKKGLADITADCVERAIYSVITPAVAGWGTNICQGNNITFNVSYQMAISDLRCRIRQEWNTNYQNSGILRGLQLNDSWANMQGCELSRGIFGKTISSAVCSTVSRCVSDLIPSLFFDALKYCILSIPISILATFIKGSFLEAWFNNKLDQKFEQYLLIPLRAKLQDLLASHEVQDKLIVHAKKLVEEIVAVLKQGCYDSLKRQKQDLEQRVSEKLSLKTKAMEEQQRVAAKCERIRKEQIDPVMERIEKFNSDLRQYFN